MQKGKDDSPVGTVKVLSKMKNSAEASRLIGMAVDAGMGTRYHDSIYILKRILHIMTLSVLPLL